MLKLELTDAPLPIQALSAHEVAQEPANPPAARRMRAATYEQETGRISDWCRITGMSRSRTYLLIAAGHLPTYRVGSATFVDIAAGLRWLRSQPPAPIGQKQAA
ncbi:hypothetical protein ACE7GA_01420 [Roseomonas sp. CCTCC AB2023176]|uniref:hypothetical protein n=1 Tax=Roseomonas sp. CCTCC AB2023176 TaxID=3342640 RepID=UPI0035E2EC70